MTRARFAVGLLTALVLGGSALQAQQKATPVRDSMKVLKKDIKTGKAQLKTARKAGDSTKVKKLSKELKGEKATRDSLKKKAEPKKAVVPLVPPAKKP